MGPAMLQGLLDGPGGVALGFEVLREIDEEVLDGPRRGQASERAGRREAEAALLRESDPGGERHAKGLAAPAVFSRSECAPAFGLANPLACVCSSASAMPIFEPTCAGCGGN